MIKIPISRPYIDKTVKYNLHNAIKSTWISSQGKYIGLFEKTFSKFNSTKYCVAVSNGTVALILALKALDIKYGDEVTKCDFFSYNKFNSKYWSYTSFS